MSCYLTQPRSDFEAKQGGSTLEDRFLANFEFVFKKIIKDKKVKLIQADKTHDNNKNLD